VTVDRDDSGANQRVSSTAAVAWPAVDLLPLLVGPPSYSGMVRIGIVSASATASAGPGAAAPSVTGSVVEVGFWNGSGYTPVFVTPGVASSTTIPSVTFFAGGGFVTVSGSITSNKGVTSHTSAGGVITEASAGLTNWLFVDLNVSITGGTSLKLHFDYGRLAAHAIYEPGT
jgi:hypothetical protein